MISGSIIINACGFEKFALARKLLPLSINLFFIFGGVVKTFLLCPDSLGTKQPRLILHTLLKALISIYLPLNNSEKKVNVIRIKSTGVQAL